MIKLIVNSLLVVFFVYSILLIWGYKIAWEAKLENPESKNLSKEDLALLGIGVAVLVVIDIIILKRFWRIFKSIYRDRGY